MSLCVDTFSVSLYHHLRLPSPLLSLSNVQSENFIPLRTELTVGMQSVSQKLVRCQTLHSVLYSYLLIKSLAFIRHVVMSPCYRWVKMRQKLSISFSGKLITH